jgi:hypothetical protein
VCVPLSPIPRSAVALPLQPSVAISPCHHSCLFSTLQDPLSYLIASHLISSCLISSCLLLSCLILSLLLNSLDYFSPTFLPSLTMFMYIFIYSFLSFHLISLSLHTPHILLYSPLLYCTLFFLTLLLGRAEQS